MKLMECPQCGMKLSDSAVACKRCAYPSRNFSSIYYSAVKISCDKKKGLTDICRVYDKELNLLAECKIGDTLNIKCTEPITVLFELFGCMCKPEIRIQPGEKYFLNIKKIGLISVKKI